MNNVKYFNHLESQFIQLKDFKKNLVRLSSIRFIKKIGNYFRTILLFMLSRGFDCAISFNISIIAFLEGVIAKIRQNEQIVLKNSRQLESLLIGQHEQAQVIAGLEAKINSGDKHEEVCLPDSMYLSFINQFRGTREDIKERQRVYIPYIEKVRTKNGEYPVLDLGCGRGEWLELMSEYRFKAKGVDKNKKAVQNCMELGLDVKMSDIVTYLKKQKKESFCAITGFHIVEHLSFNHLIRLFDDAFRVLIPGGIVIFETPNPENVIVSSCNFYFDPEHHRIIPPQTLKFLLEQKGFTDTELMRLHPLNMVEYKKDDELKHIINRFNMEQDYSVIGFKA